MLDVDDRDARGAGPVEQGLGLVERALPVMVPSLLASAESTFWRDLLALSRPNVPLGERSIP
ncbi:hypothetical protein BHQ17_22950 [Mycolicibacterium holsaticum]|uniref:Uncharacterized protein n=1 Tax=Mycolicibacterium holsaticum TaxID=152142 RepID=A0A1E3R6W0_9MYCO|nr:hypothetical protein BHQ17_22950 [Mycolicibacterium holsaticum]